QRAILPGGEPSGEVAALHGAQHVDQMLELASVDFDGASAVRGGTPRLSSLASRATALALRTTLLGGGEPRGARLRIARNTGRSSALRSGRAQPSYRECETTSLRSSIGATEQTWIRSAVFRESRGILPQRVLDECALAVRQNAPGRSCWSPRSQRTLTRRVMVRGLTERAVDN